MKILACFKLTGSCTVPYLYYRICAIPVSFLICWVMRPSSRARKYQMDLSVCRLKKATLAGF